MLKKSITYTNLFTDQEVTEDHYFHISKADLTKMELEEHKVEYVSKTGEKLTGMRALISQITESEDGKGIIAIMDDILSRAYGKKDGERFVKSPELTAEFVASEAYSALFFELCTDAEAAAQFMNGIIPRGLGQEISELTPSEIADAAMAPAESSAADLGQDESRILTLAEMQKMDKDELQSGLVTGRYKLS